ncbi:MAG TPA: molybdenum cofactor biosynthesis protein MoaE [bacterium]|nr:molybdenum cofactor biosynthesis protein MoaE [bacterium]
MLRLQITEQRIATEALYQALDDPTCGGVAIFEGRVRDHHQGRKVRDLYYECYRPMAEKILAKAAQEARTRWEPSKIAIVHRIGRIPIGEAAVWIGVAAAHREEAFAACRFLIEEIKRSVPIWKRETYVDGSCAWVACLPA